MNIKGMNKAEVLTDEGLKNVKAAKYLASAFALLVQGEKVRIPGCCNWSQACLHGLRGAERHDRGTEQQVMPQFRWAAEEMLRFFSAYQGEVSVDLKGKGCAVDSVYPEHLCADELIQHSRHIVFPGEAEMLLHFKEHLAYCLRDGFDDAFPDAQEDCAENYSLVHRRYTGILLSAAEEMVKLLDYALAGGNMSFELQNGSHVPLRSLKLGDLATCQIECNDPKAPIRVSHMTDAIMVRVSELGAGWRAMRGTEQISGEKVTNITARDKSVDFQELLPAPFSKDKINEHLGSVVFRKEGKDPFLLTSWDDLKDRGYLSSNLSSWEWWPVIGERIPQPAYDMAWGTMRLCQR